MGWELNLGRRVGQLLRLPRAIVPEGKAGNQVPLLGPRVGQEWVRGL